MIGIFRFFPFLIITNFLLAIYFFNFEARGYLFEQLTLEDKFGENLQFFAYFGSALLLLWTSRTRILKSKVEFYYLFLFGLATLFIALEEISWGSRLLGFNIESISRINVQGETNIHNLFNLYGNVTVYIVIALLIGFCVPLIEFFLYRKNLLRLLFFNFDQMSSYLILIILYFTLTPSRHPYFYEFSELPIALGFLIHGAKAILTFERL